MLPSRHTGFGLLGAALLVLLAGGCWDQVGIAERTLVIGIGIDLCRGEEPILLTAQVVNTSALKTGGAAWGGEAGGGSGGTAAASPVLLETGRGRSLAEAIHDLLGRSSRQISFSHNRIVVLGYELARTGIAGIIDEMARNYQFRPTNWILAAGATAKEIMEAKTDLGAIPAYEVHRLLLNLGKNAFIPPVDQTDLIYQFKSEAGTAVIPLIRLDRTEAVPAGRIRIDRSAVFKGDRLIAVLTPEESAGLLWLKEGEKGGLVAFPGPDGGRAKVSVEITGGAARIVPRPAGGGIVMEITCTGRGLLRAAGGMPGDPRSIGWIERRTEEVLARRVERTIERARRLNADFTGFGRRIHAVLPDRWRRLRSDWDEEFPRIKTRVRFRIELAQYGGIRHPVF